MTTDYRLFARFITRSYQKVE